MDCAMQANARWACVDSAYFLPLCRRRIDGQLAVFLASGLTASRVHRDHRFGSDVDNGRPKTGASGVWSRKAAAQQAHSCASINQTNKCFDFNTLSLCCLFRISHNENRTHYAQRVAVHAIDTHKLQLVFSHVVGLFCVCLCSTRI